MRVLLKSGNRLTAIRGEGRGGDCLKEGEGISQRTYMRDPLTWTIVRGLIMEVGVWAGWRGRNGENGTSIIA